MADHPPCEEFVVAGVELVLSKPVVVCEAVKELGILENDRAVGSSATGETGKTAINVGGRGNLDVADGETERGENLPDRHAVSTGLYTLGCTNTTDLLVLEAREDVGQEGRRPDGIVIGKDDDIGRSVFDAVGHLEPLVGKGHGQDANTLRVDRVCEFLERAQHLLLGDDENLLGLANEPAVGGLLELLSSIDGGDDDGDILLGNIGRVLG